VSITDDDKAGFMNCLHGMDVKLGLDLIIHSPGGYIAATESLIQYLRSKFAANIRVFVPQIAMSGGTILALSGYEIWMGRHSNLGPIDPQFGNIPAVTLIEEFERAYNEIKKDTDKLALWRPILAQIPPTQLTQAQQAIDLSRSIAQKTLMEGMFAGAPNRRYKARKVAKALTNVKTHKQHSRHIPFDDCKKIGLTVRRLEDNQDLQDAMLAVHHAFYITLSNTPAAKIIENQMGHAFVKNVAA
jgi:ClpP class serine protease